MTHYFKFASLTLACSATAYAIGFAWQAAPAGSSARRYSAQDASPVARKINLREGYSPIQDALCSYIIHHGSCEIDAEGDTPIRKQLIVSQNYLLMLMQDRTQQANQLKMINIERLLPGPWERVKNAPTMANAILKVTPEQERLFATWKFQGAPGAREAIRPGADFKEVRYRQLLHEQKMIRTILTPAQRSEWDAILAKIRAELGPPPSYR